MDAEAMESEANEAGTGRNRSNSFSKKERDNVPAPPLSVPTEGPSPDNSPDNKQEGKTERSTLNERELKALRKVILHTSYLFIYTI